jgi:signal transduction histidine kinase
MMNERPKGLTARPPMSEVNPSAPLVLYVDDERPNRIVFEQSLKTEFRIKTLPDAKSALELMATTEVAVLVTDVRMAEMDGLELLRIARDRHPQTLRMVITAFSDIDPIVRAINEQLVARYIIKPFERTELAQVLRWATEVWAFGKQSAEVLRRMLETERLATIGGLTSLYLHDLRTPLMAATNALDELRALVGATPELRAAIEKAPLDAKVKATLLANISGAPELLDELEQSTKQTTGMVVELHDFVSGRAPKERPVIDPLPVIQHILNMFSRIDTYRAAKIGYVGPAELPAIRMSPIALTQVLQNLVGNAAQAVIARNIPELHVEVEARPTGDMLEVRVRDEGGGISPEVLRKIGTPFFTTRAEGTGLGIANCQRLVGTAGGRLKIESEQGVGTLVTVLLPIAA